MSKQVIDAQVTEAMLNEMIKTGRDALEVGEDHGLTALQAARWCEDISHYRPMAALSRMRDMQAQLTTSLYRPSAALHLGDVVTNYEKPAEPKLRRQAAVDLLKVDFKWLREGVSFQASERSKEAEEVKAHFTQMAERVAGQFRENHGAGFGLGAHAHRMPAKASDGSPDGVTTSQGA